jgi:adenine-specific DNA-methyltransferase
MKTIATSQKLRGGYYTPKPIADFLAKWAIQSPEAQVLEPSCGDGQILEAAFDTLVRLGASKANIGRLIDGVEFDSQEALKSSERISGLTGLAISDVHGSIIHNGDFFAYCKSHLSDKRRFDAIIGNPPFIRYQNFPEEHRNIAFYLMQREGLHPNKLTNSWVPFLVASTFLLNNHGRLAMVIPAELLQVNYAAELRSFLSRYYKRLTLITFKKLVFEAIQQEVVLLLGERDGAEHSGIRTIELNGINDLASYDHTINPNDSLKEMDHSSEKWTMYFLDENELQLIRKLTLDTRLTMTRHVIDVDVGIVTGLNEFFVLSERQVEEWKLHPYTQSLVGRSAHFPGLLFSSSDWENSVKRQYPSFLLTVPPLPFDTLPEELKEYIKSGEDKGIHTGYKCRIRNKWYVVPSVWTPQAFMLRQVHNYPKIIFNEASATCTDTIHRVKFRRGINPQKIVAAFTNSLTFAFSEILGRSYGGGVLELEPNEAEKLLLPLAGSEMLDLTELDTVLREKGIEAVLDRTDDILLKKGLGLNDEEIVQLRIIWKKLRDRRLNRKHTASSRQVEGFA